MPTASATSRAHALSSSVAAPLTMSTWLICSWSVSAVPKLPCTTPVMYSQYWVSSGRSSPAAWRFSAICAALSRPPNADTIGSPITRMTKKTSVTSIQTIGITSSSRVIR